MVNRLNPIQYREMELTKDEDNLNDSGEDLKDSQTAPGPIVLDIHRSPGKPCHN
jgi:hypothetical protein